MPGYPNSRLPNTYTDNALKFVYDIAGKKQAFVYNGTSDPAVLISDCINVTGMNTMCLMNFNIMILILSMYSINAFNVIYQIAIN